jgi:hypothetical protein
MKKTELNKIIVAEARARISSLGLSSTLDIYPVENTFTRRPHYWTVGSTHFFKVHMWDLNSLDEAEWSAELDARISAARGHFNI